MSSGEARQAVGTALRMGGFEAIELGYKDVLSGLRRTDPCAGLVHDLYPWDTRSTVQIELLCHACPELSILVYAPARVGVAELLFLCAGLPGVRAELQQAFTTREAERLRKLVVSVMEEAPRRRLLRMIQAAVPHAPVRAWRFVELALRFMGRGPQSAHVTVTRLAGGLGMSERTLERSWRDAALPAPKELLEWLALLLAGLLSAQTGLTVARAARALGIDSQQLYRFRQRLLPPAVRSGREQFDSVFLAFVSRCRSGCRAVR